MTDIRKILETYGRIEERNGSFFIINSFFFLGSDESVSLRINETEDGSFILSDCGSTMDYLEIEDINIADYEESLRAILNRYNITFDSGVFQKVTGSNTEFSLKLSLGYFIQGLTLIANIDMFKRSKLENLSKNESFVEKEENNFVKVASSKDNEKTFHENENIDVLKTYEKGLNLLDSYDHQTLEKPVGSVATYELSYDECRKKIDSMSFGDTSEVFGVEKGEGKLDGILKNVEQEVFGAKVYPTAEERAAHLLYYLVKDHPFVDGCKRISATLFLEYLNKNGLLTKNGNLRISNETIATMTILVAESRADEKEMMIKLIMNLIK